MVFQSKLNTQVNDCTAEWNRHQLNLELIESDLASWDIQCQSKWAESFPYSVSVDWCPSQAMPFVNIPCTDEEPTVSWAYECAVGSWFSIMVNSSAVSAVGLRQKLAPCYSSGGNKPASCGWSPNECSIKTILLLNVVGNSVESSTQ